MTSEVLVRVLGLVATFLLVSTLAHPVESAKSTENAHGEIDPLKESKIYDSYRNYEGVGGSTGGRFGVGPARGYPFYGNYPDDDGSRFPLVPGAGGLFPGPGGGRTRLPLIPGSGRFRGSGAGGIYQGYPGFISGGGRDIRYFQGFNPGGSSGGDPRFGSGFPITFCPFQRCCSVLPNGYCNYCCPSPNVPTPPRAP